MKATARLMTAPISEYTESLVRWLKLRALGALLIFDVVAKPSAAHRPRVGRFGTYLPKTYAAYQKHCVEQIAEQAGGLGVLDGPVGVVVETRLAPLKTSDRKIPLGDVDNFAKAPLDAVKKAGVWGDDSQVVVMAATKRFAEPGEEPGVTLTIGRVAA